MSIQSIVIYSDRCEFFNFFRKWFVSGGDFVQDIDWLSLIYRIIGG